MTEIEIERFIKLLRKWKKEELTWGECNQLRDFKYQFSDAIQEYWKEWSFS